MTKKRGPKPTGKVRIQLKIDPKLNRELTRRAKVAELTRSAMVERALSVHFMASQPAEA